MTLTQYLYSFGQYFPYIIGGTLIIAILLMIYLVYISYKAAKKAKEGDGGQDDDAADKDAVVDKNTITQEKLPPLGGRISQYLTLKGFFYAGDLSLSFLNALQTLRLHLSDYNYKYTLPWYLVLGARGSGKTTLVSQSDIKQDLEFQEFNDLYPKAGCNWSFFNQAVVLDIAGQYFIDDKEPKDDWGGWRALLSLLSRYRSRYPINGVILTLPVTEFYGPDKLNTGQITDRARFLSNKLLKAQNTLGLTLPVYIVITKCDQLAGFQELANNIPTEKSFNMLGWSNPYTLESSYISSWVNEAFGKVKSTLNNLRLQILTRNIDKNLQDGVFVLPQSIDSIKESVAIYLDNFFKQSSYQEALTFRGIYFTGQVGEFDLNQDILSSAILKDENGADQKAQADVIVEPIMPFAPGAESGAPSDNSSLPDTDQIDQDPQTNSITNTAKKMYFIHDLLVKKIFNEQGLARPISYRLQSANRSLNFLRGFLAVFVLCGFLGLSYTYNRLNNNKNYLNPILDRISIVLSQIEQSKSQPQLTINLLNSHGRDLLNMMSQVRSVNFNSLFIPSSWGSSINQDLRNTLSISYEHIILRSIYLDLLMKLTDLIRLRPGMEDTSSQIDQLLLPSTSPEFLLIKYYTDQFTPLIKIIEKYNALKSAPDAKLLDELMEFSFGIKLPDDFNHDYKNFKNHLNEFNYPLINLPSYRPQTQRTLTVLWDHFLNSMLSTDNTKGLIVTLNETLSLMQNTVSVSPEVVKKMRDLSRFLSLAIPQMGPEGATWVDLPYFNLGASFTQLIESIETNQMLGNSLVGEIAQKTAPQFRQFILELTKLNNFLVDPQTLDPSKKIYPSTGLFILQKSLAQFFKQSFMQPFTADKLDTRVPDKKYINWNQGFINEAVRQIKIYKNFESKDLQSISPALRPVLKLIAHQNIEELVLTNLSKAKELADDLADDASENLKEEQLRQRIKNFVYFSKDFIEILEFYKSNSQSPYYVQLKNFFGSAAYAFLQQISIIIKKSNLYQVRDNNFEWWAGNRNVAFQAFGVKDREDLNALIKQHHGRIKMMALDYAAPLIQFLKNPNIQSSEVNQVLISVWERIIDQLKAYDMQKPESSVTKLDVFLGNELNECTLENIFKKFAYDTIVDESGDYFLEQIRSIKERILSRAEVLKRKKSVELYNKMRKAFNDNLADKFPFVTSIASNTIAECEPQHIKYFFKIFDEAGGDPREILDQVHQLGPQAGNALYFLNEMKKVREFFADYIEGHPDPNKPMYDISIDFRVERPRERNANMILDWFFMPDEINKINHMDKERLGRWEFGSQIEMGFRWADGAITAPVGQANDPFMLVTNKTARFVYQGRWSLLWMVRFQHNSGDSMQNPQPYNLRFVVPTNDSKQAVVYNKLTIKSIPKGDEPGKVLRLPNFPRFAPPLDNSVMQVMNAPVLIEQAIGRPVNLSADDSQDMFDDFGENAAGENSNGENDPSFNDSNNNQPAPEWDVPFDEFEETNFDNSQPQMQNDDVEVPEFLPEEEDDLVTEDNFADDF